MNITFKINSNIEDKATNKQMSKLSTSTMAAPQISIYKSAPDLSFKGSPSAIKEVASIKTTELIRQFKNALGETAAEDLTKCIDKLAQKENPWVKVTNEELKFKNETIFNKIDQFLIRPIINLPIDAANFVLKGLKKNVFKNSKTLDNLINSNLLKNRTEYKENFSNAMAIKNLHNSLKKNVDKKGILQAAHIRFSNDIGNYSTNSERTITRLMTGIVPAFFLANDAYNLSMYINNNKEAAKKEKERRFNQEAIRILITAASSFAILNLLNKKASTSSTTFWLVLTTIGSEIIGRIMAGTPFYPVGEKGAKKYAELQNKKNLKKNQDKNVHTIANQTPSKVKTDEQKDTTTKNNGLKLLGGMILIGLGMEKLPKYIRPLKELMEKNANKYKAFFKKDYTITKKELDDIIEQLNANGFKELANSYKKIADDIITKGNLTVKENELINQKKLELINEKLPKGFFVNPDSQTYKDLKTKAEEKAKKAISDLKSNFAVKNNDEIIHLCSVKDTAKDNLINKIIKFPYEVVKSIIKMPYDYLFKPLYEMPKQIVKDVKATVEAVKKEKIKSFKNIMSKYQEIAEGSAKKKDKNALNEAENMKNSIEFIKKLNKESGITNPKEANDIFKDKFGKKLIESFDDVTKSTISNAELSGPLKTAVSTATSAFLVFDNYNMVMIDSQGQNKDMADQKAKERTIQRIVRIAYGATIINAFNAMFSKLYHGSMFGAQVVNVSQTILTEMLERKSVGLPIGESTREDIIENDKKNIEATGILGAYFKLMSIITGKKPLSEKTYP